MSTGTDAPLRVVLTVSSLVPETGGPARSISGMAGALAARGLDVTLVSVDYGARFSAPILPDNGARTRLVPCRWSRGLTSVWTPGFGAAVRGAIGVGAACVVHDNGLWLPTNHDAVRAAQAAGVPLVVSPRGTLLPRAMRQKGPRKRIAWRLYQRRDLRRARALHATSPQEADSARALGMTQPIAVVPNGVEIRPLAARDRGSARSRRAVFLGRIHRQKNLLDLVRAWAAVRPAGWRMTLAGPDEGHGPELRQAIGNAGLDGQLELVGPVEGEAKWRLLEDADLFVLPSPSENFGMSIAEALAAGVPAIATRGAPWPELVSRRCGWWVDVGADALAAALREACSLRDEQRDEMGRRGRELIASSCSWDVVAGRMASVYEWLVRGGSPPECVRC